MQPPSYVSAFPNQSYAAPMNSYSQEHARPNPWFTQYYNTMNQDEISHLQKWFTSVDSDKSGKIDQYELSQMHMPGDGPYSGRVLGHAAASQLIKLFDLNNDGEIDFFEYAALHAFMDRLHTCFHKCDVDKNGVLDFNEISNAIIQAGFHVPHDCMQKYFNKYQKGNGLDFIQFMHMISEIAFIKSKFESLDHYNRGLLNLEDVIYLCTQTTFQKPVVIPNQAPMEKAKVEYCSIS